MQGWIRSQLGEECVPPRRGHRALDFHAHDGVAATSLRILLDRLQQIARVRLVDVQLGAAGDTKEVRFEDVPAAVHDVEPITDDLLDEHHGRAAARWNEARQR